LGVRWYLDPYVRETMLAVARALGLTVASFVMLSCAQAVRPFAGDASARDAFADVALDGVIEDRHESCEWRESPVFDAQFCTEDLDRLCQRWAESMIVSGRAVAFCVRWQHSSRCSSGNDCHEFSAIDGGNFGGCNCGTPTSGWMGCTAGQVCTSSRNEALHCALACSR
jgi:hypothetical protein